MPGAPGNRLNEILGTKHCLRISYIAQIINKLSFGLKSPKSYHVLRAHHVLDMGWYKLNGNSGRKVQKFLLTEGKRDLIWKMQQLFRRSQGWEVVYPDFLSYVIWLTSLLCVKHCVRLGTAPGKLKQKDLPEQVRGQLGQHRKTLPQKLKNKNNNKKAKTPITPKLSLSLAAYDKGRLGKQKAC